MPMEQTTANPILTELPRFEAPYESTAVYGRPARTPWKIPRINLILLLLTLFTTTMGGADSTGVGLWILQPLSTLANFPSGLLFSIPLMTILFAHEMGHYLTARRYGVESTLPYFIPAPIFIGTFGAFIRMRTPPRTRRAMFDIGAAGPWAGFILALAATVVGLKLSKVTPLDSSIGGIELGNSMLFWGLSRSILGVDPNAVEIVLHPLAWAGWVGLLVTALNLMPVGQLDGGHVVYSLLGARWHRLISRFFTLGILLMAAVPLGANLIFHMNVKFWSGWLVWFVLVFVLGLGHPSTYDSDTGLTRSRRIAAWATILVFIVTFSPVPLSFKEPTEQPPPSTPSHNMIDVSIHPPPSVIAPNGSVIRI
jgi:membrane-associated protease RseP (regulator of RpoE activity)